MEFYNFIFFHRKSGFASLFVRTVNFAGMRKSYSAANDVFDIHDLQSKEPVGQFMAWFHQALESTSTYEANAMSLATTTR